MSLSNSDESRPWINPISSRPLDERPDDSEFDDDPDDDVDDEPEPPACSVCQKPFADSFHLIQDTPLCETCSLVMLELLQGRSGRFGRIVRAFVFGSLAAVAGFLIYFVVMKFLKLEIGLISILVGYMVGAAVRKGASHRGGALYQLMAIFLTYTAIAISYSAVFLPPAIEKFKEQAELKKKADAEEARNPNAAAPAPEAPKPPLNRGELVVAVLTLLGLIIGLVYSIPVLMGFQSPFGLLIIGFALWEAWKLNRRLRVSFSGPHPIDQFHEAGAGEPLPSPG